MTKRRSLFIFLFILLIITTNHQIFSQGKNKQSTQSTTCFQRDIKKILNDPLFAPTFIGIKIFSLEQGTILFSENSNKLFHPASNMKLLITAAAINYLDKDFHFKTIATSDPDIKDGILNGHIYIKGFGDPLLNEQDLDLLVEEIYKYGIRFITGNIVGDVSYFDTVEWGKGWIWNDEPEIFAPFISPLIVNGGTVKIIVTPGFANEESVRVSFHPISRYFSITNQGITSYDAKLSTIKVHRIYRTNNIIIDGTLKPDEHLDTFKISVWQPALYTLEILKDKLAQKNVIVQGKVKLGVDRGVLQIAELKRSIDSVLIQTNKESNNLAAENLLKTIAAEQISQPGSFENGLLLLKEYLINIGIDTTKITIADASGLSFYNALSPDAIVHLLQKQYENKTTFKRFFQTLPIAGVDGTLKKRLQYSPIKGNVWAKTGSLSGVSTISGYLRTVSGKMLAFSIMCNHFPGDISDLRKLQDKILVRAVNLQK